MSTTEISFCSPVSLEEEHDTSPQIIPSASSLTSSSSKTINVQQQQQIVTQSYLSSTIAVISMTILFGLVLYGPIVLIILIVLAAVDNSTMWCTLLLIVFFCSIAPSRGRWEAFRSHPIWATWREYFDFKIICTGKLHPNRQYLFAEFPHAVFPMGFWLSATAYKDLNIRPVVLAVASVLFRVPIVRCLCFWGGCVPAVRKYLMDIFTRGESIAILPGGIAEIFLQSTEEEHVFLRERKGFIRMAIEMGVEIVPVYHLGNTSLFDYSNYKTLSRWSRKLQMSVVIFWGRWFLPLPYRRPVVMVIGEPIPVRMNPEPTNEEVEELHGRFVDALKKLFQENKHVLPGWENKQLVIL